MEVRNTKKSIFGFNGKKQPLVNSNVYIDSLNKKPWPSREAVEVTAPGRQARPRGDMKTYSHLNGFRNKLIHRGLNSFVVAKVD